ncbi:MAG TPA: HNH endonuclease family protein, partial [Rugosimonospora sp.]|nr:HNH endonuclease family protein [Rugosimonospora sp.]
TGAQQWDADTLHRFGNDPLNLLAVDGAVNQSKGAGDASEWLPPNSAFQCRYVARQVAVKAAYGLWVTPQERAAMATVLVTCPGEPLPLP